MSKEVEALDLSPLSVPDLLCTSALTAADHERIFTVALALKRGREQHTDLLRHKRLAMIFEKDSLRTRFTFDVGIQDLGGSAVFMDHRDARLGSRESVKDMARNLERWVHGIVARTFKHKVLEELAANADIPVVNGLSDFVHPCQALADFLTLHEKWGDVRGRTLTYVGDGNNTCHSLIYTPPKLGAEHHASARPRATSPTRKVVNEAMKAARDTGAEVAILNDPAEAADGADAIYTDVWASMGQEDEIEERNGIFAPYQVDAAMMARAQADAHFMHCLPAHRGWEVTQDVMDGPQSHRLRHRREPPARAEGDPRAADPDPLSRPMQQTEEDRARLLRRPRHLDHRPWLKERYDGCEVHAYCRRRRPGREELDELEEKAAGVRRGILPRRRPARDFLTDYVWPCVRAMAVYEGRYLLGTSMARPILAKGQVEYAREVGADAVAHGCTGKGNDQVRFELAYQALAPDLEIIAPWRHWDIESPRGCARLRREARGIPVTASRTKIYSRDRNLWHISHEGGVLETRRPTHRRTTSGC